MPEPLRPDARPVGSRRRATAVVVQGCRLPRFEPILRSCAETRQATHHADVDVFVADGNACSDHELVDLDALAAHVGGVSLDMRFEGHPSIGVKAQCVVLSGSALLLSRDMAQRLVDDAPRLITASDYRYGDDVSLAKWVAAEISDTDPGEMTARHRRGDRPTTDNTFVAPPTGFRDYCGDGLERHRPVERACQYHFDTDLPDDMRRFHRRMLARTVGVGAA